MKTMILEPNLLVRELLTSICNADLGLNVQSASIPQADPTSFETMTADLFIIAITLGQGCGLFLSRQLKRRQPKCRIVLTAPNFAPVAISQAREIQVNGMIATQFVGRTQLGELIGTASRGGYACNLSANAANAHDYLSRILSPYQMHLLCLIGGGQSDDEIAGVMNIAPSTMQSRRRDIMRKLNIHCTPKLMRFAIAIGLTCPGEWGAEVYGSALGRTSVPSRIPSAARPATRFSAVL